MINGPAPNAGGLGSIPGQGTRTAHAATKDPTCMLQQKIEDLNKVF